MKKNQKVKSQKVKKLSLFDFSGLFDFSSFRFSGHFSTFRDFSGAKGPFKGRIGPHISPMLGYIGSLLGFEVYIKVI